MVTGAWMDNSHFGACLSPQPDGSLLVIKAVPQHPLGLVPADIVLGYDGIPWKVLYKELLAAELPLLPAYFWGSSKSAMTHNMLKSAGMNWHLFDTLDVVKYSSGDTMHYSTAPLASQSYFIFGNEQLEIPGVPWPSIDGEGKQMLGVFSLGDYVSWGIVEGTEIGYIYIIAWASNQQIPGSNISTEFYNAVDSLMNYYDTRGLIIDNRLNYGGDFGVDSRGLSLLFDSITVTIAFDERCGDPNNHFQLCPHPEYTTELNTIPGDSMSFYNKPIAVLVGPGAVSAGDLFTLRMAYHPMVRFFGKPTAGGFSSTSYTNLNGNADWWIFKTDAVAYSVGDPGNYLVRNEFEVDEEIWFSPEDVAQGYDTVVEKAIEWILNTSSVENTEIYPNKIYMKQNYPNPFNPSTIIEFMLPKSDYVDLKVYNVLGEKVSTIVSKKLNPGNHTYTFDGKNLASGIYYYQLAASDYHEVKKMILLK
jgi:hypothetical protein